jgi:F-type H+-transporting ATPase subunit b
MVQLMLAPARRLRAHRLGVRVGLAALVLFTCLVGSASAVQPHEPAAAQPAPAAGAHAQPAAEEHEEDHGGGLLQTVARLFNFAVLVGVLVYYLKAPIAAYLVSRSTQIRQDLVTAAETRAAATAQLAKIKEQLAGLPAELEALRVQGAEDVRNEKARIAQAAAVERERLIGHTRREIAMMLRIARRQLVELAADLTVAAARERVTRTITPDDQLRLVDRYTTQLQRPEAR